MKRRMIKILNCILILSLTTSVAGPMAEGQFRVKATTISEVQEQIENTQNQLEGINDKIDTLSDEQALIEELIDDINAEIVNTMTSIGMKEDEIVSKEAELTAKQAEVDKTQKAYEDAKAKEEKQYADMLVRMKLMYENGYNTYLSLFLSGEGLSDILNRMDYIERFYDYDRNKLQEYENTKNEVHDLWDFLEAEKAQLEIDKANLESDKQS